jgi:thiosulfate dehydrogenase [quinone] large subunit
MLQQPVQALVRFVATELRKPGAYLLPVRIFIAVGWLRACAEKIVDPAWLSGQALTAFLSGQQQSGQVAFGFYQELIKGLFLPHSALLSSLILVGQLLVGLGLLFGLFTRGALLGGLLMNINFLLAGRPDPNAFYLVIQAMLLFGAADQVLSVDGLLARRWFSLPLPGAATAAKRALIGKTLSVLAALGSAAVVVYAYLHISNFAPAASIHDSAAVLCVLANVGFGLSLIAFVRQTAPTVGQTAPSNPYQQGQSRKPSFLTGLLSRQGSPQISKLPVADRPCEAGLR